MGTGGHNVPLVKTENGIRKLTPQETFNLQGFPKSSSCLMIWVILGYINKQEIVL